MYFDIFSICIRKDLFEIGILNLSLMPKEKGVRHLFSFRIERNEDNKKVFMNIHFLFNFNYAWLIK